MSRVVCSISVSLKEAIAAVEEMVALLRQRVVANPGDKRRLAELVRLQEALAAWTTPQPI
jgi:hypothetical protein